MRLACTRYKLSEKKKPLYKSPEFQLIKSITGMKFSLFPVHCMLNLIESGNIRTLKTIAGIFKYTKRVTLVL
jgi:hypothetical protein